VSIIRPDRRHGGVVLEIALLKTAPSSAGASPARVFVAELVKSHGERSTAMSSTSRMSDQLRAACGSEPVSTKDECETDDSFHCSPGDCDDVGIVAAGAATGDRYPAPIE
jgi:hypothetical protein